MASNYDKVTGEISKELCRKRSNGRRKIPIETIRDPTKKHVTFSKRRVGLFKKASELCALCRVEMTILTFSERGKLFCFGHPNPDSVICRYLSCRSHCSDHDENPDNNELSLMIKEHNRRYEEVKMKIETEKRFGVKNDESGGFWWDEARVDEMGLDELDQFMACLVELRNNVAKHVDGLLGTTLSFPSNQTGNNIAIDHHHINANYNNNNYNYHVGSSSNSTSNLMMMENTNLDIVSQGFNFGVMNEGFLNYAITPTNHLQVPMMEDHENTLINHHGIVPWQGFKIEGRR